MSNNEESIKENETKRSYSIEDILEMLSGHEYYDDDTVKFIFHK